VERRRLARRQSSRAGIGSELDGGLRLVRIDQFDRFVRILRRILIRKVHFFDGMPWKDYFETDDKALIVFNHGPSIGPLVWVLSLFPRVVDMGYGHLHYSAIAHPIISNVPFFARMVGFEKRGGARLGVEDYVDLFNANKLNLLSVTPEGEFSLYGNGVDVQPFRSPRGLEIALRAKCRIILVVGKGFESWQRNISIEAAWKKRIFRWMAMKLPFVDRLDETALAQAEQLSISGILGRIPDFYVSSAVYEPRLTLETLSRNKKTRTRQLWTEADRMRQEMIVMLDDLKQRNAGFQEE
jgi:hypothetical protein